MKNMRRCFLLLVSAFFLMQGASAQTYLLRSKKAVIKDFQRYVKSVSYKSTVSLTDTTVTLLVKDTTVGSLYFTCYFNEKNKCYKQTKTMDCTECFEKFFSNVMNMKRYEWKKVSDHMYLSKPFWATVLLIDPAVPYSFSLVHEYFSRQEHKKRYAALK